MNEKLFIALPVPAEIERAAVAWQVRHPDWPVRWLSPEQFHLTLLAPWEEAEPEAVIAKLEEFAASPLAAEIGRRPLGLDFNRLGPGPNRFSPRLVWAEGRAPVALLELKNRLEQVLAKPDHRFYRLHLTLARFRPEALTTDPQLAPVGVLNEIVDWRGAVDRFALYRSVFGADQTADYFKLKEFSLTR